MSKWPDLTNFSESEVLFVFVPALLLGKGTTFLIAIFNFLVSKSQL